MIKRNIISGLLLFSISITLGPYMMGTLGKEEAQVKAQTELQTAFGELRKAQAAQEETRSDAGPDLESVSAVASATARAAKAHINYYFAQFRRGNVALTHAHGNLQGMLNILVGLFLVKLAVDARIRLAISWGFVAGSWIMVGAQIAGNMLGLRWALQGMLPGGYILMLSLFALTLAVIIKGFEEAPQPAD